MQIPQTLIKSLLAVAALSMAATGLQAQTSDAQPVKTTVFAMHENGSKFYRIPALCCTPKGTLVAVADKRGDDISDLPNTISVVAKRSTDNGDTWSEMITLAQGDSSLGKTYGDPAIVCDSMTGTILCLFVGDTGFFASPDGSDRMGVYMVKSTDDGLTWSQPVAITDQVYQPDWRAAFIASGTGHQDASGRIMFVANSRCSNASGTIADVYEFLVYTDDLGETWHVANPAGRAPEGGYGNESKVVELQNGDLLMSMRYGTQRRFMKSGDRGATWRKPYKVPELVEPGGGGCNGDIIRYPSTDGKAMLIQSTAASTRERRDVSVLLSLDDGATWPVKRQLVDGRSAYSALTVLADGSIGCLVEEGWGQIGDMTSTDGFTLNFIRFTLDWLVCDYDVNQVVSYPVTIQSPAERHGTLRLYDGTDEIISGQEVAKGTELTVKAIPADPFMVETIFVNGEALAKDADNFVVSGETSVAAEFVRDPAQRYVYVEPYGKSLSDANCFVEKAVTSGAVEDISVMRSAKLGDFYELCDDQRIVVHPGTTFSLRLQAKKTNSVTTSVPSPQDLRYCVAYIFADWDGDGIFELQSPTRTLFSGQDYYGYHADDNKFAGNTKANYDYTLDITHQFSVPDDAAIGDSRLRVIYTEAWDANVKKGAVTGDYQGIDKGYSYDYPVTCLDFSSVCSLAQAEAVRCDYFTLQGERISGFDLLPGIYVMRQGGTAKKVAVR